MVLLLAPSLFGCALAWFFWDVSFYGNKLFQSTFIKILSPGASILLTLEWTLLNSFISLVASSFYLQAPAVSPTSGICYMRETMRCE